MKSCLLGMLSFNVKKLRLSSYQLPHGCGEEKEVILHPRGAPKTLLKLACVSFA